MDTEKVAQSKDLEKVRFVSLFCYNKYSIHELQSSTMK